MTIDKLAFVDVETTGCSGSFDRVIEIGIVRVERDKIVQTYNSLINPQTHLPPYITTITGIKPEDLEDAPSFEYVKDEVSALLSDCIFVAHNARFDYGFIKNEFYRFGVEFSSRLLCTVKLSRALFPQYHHHNLDSLIERHRISCENRHRAFSDAKVLWDFYQLAQKKVRKNIFLETVHKILKKPSLPTLISPDTVENLPEKPGVYIFYAENNVPLYIGKSIDIRERVLSHFSSDINATKEMDISRQVKDIQTFVTNGELSALILESQLVKELHPLYNKRLRNQKEIHVLKRVKSKKGYDTVQVEAVSHISHEDYEDILGVFKSKKQAKDFLHAVAKEHNLCLKLLGIEKGKGECFFRKINVCKGACNGKEKPIAYNIRSILAFSKTKIKKWPFSGPIVIRENIQDNQGIIIDQWCYLGTTSSIDRDTKDKFDFDYDLYKIVLRYLSNPHNLKKIRSGRIGFK